jgi:hypothetical protein
MGLTEAIAGGGPPPGGGPPGGGGGLIIWGAIKGVVGTVGKY